MLVPRVFHPGNIAKMKIRGREGSRVSFFYVIGELSSGKSLQRTIALTRD